MIVLYDFQFCDESQCTVSVQDRGLLYGDGLFETIVVRKGRICFLEDHLDRLKLGLKILHFRNLSLLRPAQVTEYITRLMELNNIESDARVRITVWRRAGGLYTPENFGFHILISCKPFEQQPPAQLSAGFSSSVRLGYSRLSRFKTISALEYVLAGLEKMQRGLQEIILLDHHGNVAECSASNLFWVKDQIVFTPKLRSGCIAGIARKNLIRFLKGKGLVVAKKFASKEELMTADHVFLCNVSGIHHISAIDDQSYSNWELLDQPLIEDFFAAQ